MRVIHSPQEMQEAAATIKRKGARLALVPTMGCLHEGHLSLMRVARANAEKVIVSIFVNPTQFGPGEDFERYPRVFEKDARLCDENGVDIIFAPEPGMIYMKDHSVFLEENHLAMGLCGASRPGHFRGVLTVVAKLFNICLPDLAVFGEKDAQQARLIMRMTRDLNFPVRVILAPIVREPDGLAMSSRNQYLSPDERARATVIYRTLQAVKALYEQGERNAEVLLKFVKNSLQAEPGTKIDYVAAVDSETLQPIATVIRPTLLAVAVFFGTTRLIDNIVLGANSQP